MRFKTRKGALGSFKFKHVSFCRKRSAPVAANWYLHEHPEELLQHTSGSQ